MNLMGRYLKKQIERDAQKTRFRHVTESPTATEKVDRPKYTIIYSHILDDFLLLVQTDQDKASLQASGCEDVIYTTNEVQKLKGLPVESIKAHHRIKKTFPGSRIEE